MPYQGPGIYQHHKGGLYEVLGLGIHEHAKDNDPAFDLNDTRQQYVVYRPLTDGSLLDGTPLDFWIRNLQVFDQYCQGQTGGKGPPPAVPRFEFVGRRA